MRGPFFLGWLLDNGRFRWVTFLLCETQFIASLIFGFVLLETALPWSLSCWHG
jgi:hypothetical protein